MAEKIRILYIDDNPGDRALVKDSLEKEHSGYSLMLAKSKEEFEKLIHKHIFDLVLTDFNILGFEGLQVLATVQEVSPGTPVIVVTGTGSEEIAVQALKRGASDYIIKSPQHIVRLPNSIKAVLERKQFETEQHKGEEELLKMNRVYSLVSQINQLIVRTSDREILFQHSCNIAVNYGKFQMAWIGLIDSTTDAIKPYCWAGNEDGYLENINIKISDKEPEGRGPTGTAFREGKYFVCNDIEHDPIMEPWRNEALKRGYGSSIGIPIKQENEVIGTLTIYAHEPDFFDHKEIMALREITNDISYALDAIKADEIRRKTEEELIKMNRVFALISQINQLIVRTRDRDKLFQEACNIAINFGQFRMAWIGLVEENSDRYRIHCFAGHEEGYLSKTKIKITNDIPEGRGPAGKALREGKFIVCNNIARDPIMAPWKKEALKRNYHSSITLPIKQEGITIGTFNIYAEESGFFDSQEIRLLEEVVDDISFALDMIKADEIRRKAEKDLLERQEELQAYFEHDISADFLVTTEGKLISCNKTFYKMFGIESELQKEQFDISQFYKNPETRKELIEEIRKNGKVEDFEIEFITKNGEPLYVLGNIQGNFGEFGELVSLREYIVDITKRKTAEESLIKLSRAVEQSPETIVITNKDGKIEYVNPTFTKVTGYTSEEIIGENPRILSSHEKLDQEYKEMWDIILSGNIWRGEFHDKKKNGELYWEQASISPIIGEKGEITHFVAVKEDITEIKAKDLELKMALEKAQESDRLKSAFLANMSHEIRTPMNGIIGFAELLKEPRLNGDQQREYLDIIEKSANRMLNIITDIVNISKIEAGQMDVYYTEFNINKEMDFLYSFFKPDTDQKQVKLSYHKDLPDSETIIKTDREKISSILTNLIKNAIKFTSNGFIEFGYQKKENVLEFFIKDTGIGILDENKDVVFERFRQGSEYLTHHYEGSGLGLSISKAYVEMLGGKIWFKSINTKENHGTEFYFTLPFYPITNNKLIKDNKVAIDKLENENQKRLKILIVEDDEVSEMLLKYVLEPFSKEFLTTASGKKAIEICKQNPDIDIIMMDIRIPEMDGYESARQIRKFNKDVLIIAQTAFALEGDREKAMEAGCNDYISKPIQLDKFKVILQKFDLS
ncbi:MAG: GAF domain-containing protein [Bacteroidales bacterium]|nr:GAF domain-containing protein [Bacteroidales bacterium]